MYGRDQDLRPERNFAVCHGGHDTVLVSAPTPLQARIVAHASLGQRGHDVPLGSLRATALTDAEVYECSQNGLETVEVGPGVPRR